LAARTGRTPLRGVKDRKNFPPESKISVACRTPRFRSGMMEALSKKAENREGQITWLQEQVSSHDFVVLIWYRGLW